MTTMPDDLQFLKAFAGGLVFGLLIASIFWRVYIEDHFGNH